MRNEEEEKGRGRGKLGRKERMRVGEERRVLASRRGVNEKWIGGKEGGGRE